MHTDDPIYKKKRKALSAAFFKSKMSLIAKIVKQTTLRCFAELQAKGPSNEVELNSFTSNVQAHIIVSIMAGVGHSHKLLPYQNLNTGEEEMLTAGTVMDRIVPDIMNRIMSNPLLVMIPSLMDREWTAKDRRFFANCKHLRGFIRDIVVEKKNSKDAEAGDVISLILEDLNYQDEDDIIDDVIIMFLAGSQTV